MADFLTHREHDATFPPLHTHRPPRRKFSDSEMLRLGLALSYPRLYSERRVERLRLTFDRKQRVDVFSQLQIPLLQGESTAEGELLALVSLGIFSKGRLPDLRARDAYGGQLAILGRRERAATLSALFIASWARRHAGTLIESDRPDEANAVRSFLRLVHGRLTQIIVDDQAAAEAAARRLVLDIRRLAKALARDDNTACPPLVVLAIARIADDNGFERAVTALAHSTHVLALVRGVPGSSTLLTVKYTEPVDYRLSVREEEDRLPDTESRFTKWVLDSRLAVRNRGSTDAAFSWGTRIGGTVDHALTSGIGALAWLGLIPVPIRRRNPNYDHAESFYLATTAPDGADVTRSYWFSQRGLPSGGSDVVAPSDSEGILACYQSPGGSPVSGDTSAFELQMSRYGPVRLAGVLSAFLAAVSYYVLRHGQRLTAPMDRAEFLGVLAIFAGLPAALISYLSLRSDALVGVLTRGPRKMLALLGYLALAFTAMLGLRRTFDGAAALAALIVEVLALAITLVTGYIALGPRFTRSRRLGWAERVPVVRRLPAWVDRAPIHRRAWWQRFCAFAYALIAIVVIALVAIDTWHYRFADTTSLISGLSGLPKVLGSFFSS